MLFNAIFKSALLPLFFYSTNASPPAGPHNQKFNPRSEPIQIPAATRVAAPIVPTVLAKIDNAVVKLNTSSSPAEVDDPAPGVAITTAAGTVLILARDAPSSYSAFSTLNAYGIPYQVVLVPKDGAELPVLNSSVTAGNYGAIVILSEVSYQYVNSFESALTQDQWAQLYQYQVNFAVRMVRLDVFPSFETGATALGSCCDTGVEQLISITNSSAFPTAGLKLDAGVSTSGLWHYPAKITDASHTVEIAQFAPAASYNEKSTAAVINTFGGRQQMVWFTGFASDWSATSNFLNHAWVTWATRGLYAGHRRINFSTQVDDMFLTTELYSPVGGEYVIGTKDLQQHVTWTPTVNTKLPPGSEYFVEVGHNGNGNIENAANTTKGESQCGIGPIEYDEQIDTPLEFAKPLGTGTNLWPDEPDENPYTTSCTDLDSLKTWWATPANRDAFAHVSHTFTHEDENNATYFDVSREITWNVAWLNQVGISNATRWSPQGIIPPAITGLHNGDALQAWKENGIIYVVGDNTRPVLMNTKNEHWPLITTVADNGYDGIQITPRWASNIYYNCAVPDCTVLEWQNTAHGTGTYEDLIAIEKNTNVRHLLALHHDGFMFHQANLNCLTVPVPTTTVNGVSENYSMLQTWVETMTTELIRLVTWPIISLKHDDLALSFLSRMNRDACNPILTYSADPSAKTITSITLTTTGNTCAEKVPVTVPGTVTDTQGFLTEQIGSDPLTIWVQLTGSPITFTLSTPVPFYS